MLYQFQTANGGSARRRASYLGLNLWHIARVCRAPIVAVLSESGSVPVPARVMVTVTVAIVWFPMRVRASGVV